MKQLNCADQSTHTNGQGHFTEKEGAIRWRDNGPVVDKAYKAKAPYALTGTVRKVTFDLKKEHIEAEKALHEHGAMQTAARGAAG